MVNRVSCSVEFCTQAQVLHFKPKNNFLRYSGLHVWRVLWTNWTVCKSQHPMTDNTSVICFVSVMCFGKLHRQLCFGKLCPKTDFYDEVELENLLSLWRKQVCDPLPGLGGGVQKPWFQGAHNPRYWMNKLCGPPIW